MLRLPATCCPPNRATMAVSHGWSSLCELAQLGHARGQDTVYRRMPWQLTRYYCTNHVQITLRSTFLPGKVTQQLFKALMLDGVTGFRVYARLHPLSKEQLECLCHLLSLASMPYTSYFMMQLVIIFRNTILIELLGPSDIVGWWSKLFEECLISFWVEHTIPQNLGLVQAMNELRDLGEKPLPVSQLETLLTSLITFFRNVYLRRYVFFDT